MKNIEHKCKILKDKLRIDKERGKKEVRLKLTYYEVEYVKTLGYLVKPFLYQIKTKKFYHIRTIDSVLVKEVYYKHKSGKITYLRTLNVREMKELDKYCVRYNPVNYTVYLRRCD